MKYTLSIRTKHQADVATLTTLAAMIRMNRKLEQATLGQLLFEDYTTLCDPVQAIFAVTEIVAAATSLFYEEDEDGNPSPIFKNDPQFLTTVRNLGDAMSDLGSLLSEVAIKQAEK